MLLAHRHDLETGGCRTRRAVRLRRRQSSAAVPRTRRPRDEYNVPGTATGSVKRPSLRSAPAARPGHERGDDLYIRRPAVGIHDDAGNGVRRHSCAPASGPKPHGNATFGYLSATDTTAPRAAAGGDPLSTVPLSMSTTDLPEPLCGEELPPLRADAIPTAACRRFQSIAHGRFCRDHRESILPGPATRRVAVPSGRAQSIGRGRSAFQRSLESGEPIPHVLPHRPRD